MSTKDADLEPIVNGRGATILGPRNVPIERENPDVLVSPAKLRDNPANRSRLS